MSDESETTRRKVDQGEYRTRSHERIHQQIGALDQRIEVLEAAYGRAVDRYTGRTAQEPIDVRALLRRVEELEARREWLPKEHSDRISALERSHETGLSDEEITKRLGWLEETLGAHILDVEAAGALRRIERLEALVAPDDFKRDEPSETEAPEGAVWYQLPPYTLPDQPRHESGHFEWVPEGSTLVVIRPPKG